jgi:gliding motility-associated-like protein
MLRRIYILLFILLGTSAGFAQNLVLNPSFEDVIDCYYNVYVGNIDNPYTNCRHWYDVNERIVRDMTDCEPKIGYNRHVPQNSWGYQYARTGGAYVAMGVNGLNGVSQTQSDYLTSHLKDTLIAGKEYCVSYYVVIPENFNWAFDRGTGMYFSPDSIYYTDWCFYFLTPQVENPIGNYINDTLNWMQIKGSFVASGGEEYIAIGGFVDFFDINSYVIDTSLPTQYLSVGYYIDDVAVYPCDADVYVADGGGDVQLCLGDSVRLGSHELGEYLYWWYDMQGNLIADRTGYITVIPQQTTQYELVVKDFKFEETKDTITVYVEDCFTDEIYVPNIFSPNGDGNNDILFVRSEYIQSLTFKVYNRWGETVFESEDINKGWNGEYKGKRCNAAVFVWYLEAVMTNGQLVKRSGNVSLVR